MLIIVVITLLLLAERQQQSYGSGFDSYSSCYRTSRQRQQLPCDFTRQNWCASPGSAYPWHAVRRFVHENQGLMKRMYGEERHISVLRAELENEVEYFHDADDKDETRQRYSKTFSSTLLSATGTKTSKSVKTKKAISSIGSGKNNFGEMHKGHPDLSKSTPLVTLKPHIAVETATVSTATTETTTNSATPTTHTTSNVSTSPSSREPSTSTQIEVSEQSHQETTLLPNETHAGTTETELPVPTTDTQELEATTEEVSDDPSYAEQDTYPDSGEEVEEDSEADDSDDEDPPKSPPILRLKGINACPVKEEVVAPFWANNTRGEVLALLNLYPFEQYVHWEKCSYENKQMFCREGCKCEQQYRLHRLLAYDPNNECRGIFSDWFRFPSCCVCKCYDVPMELRLTSRSPRSPALTKMEPGPT